MADHQHLQVVVLGQHVGDVLDGRQEVGPDRGALVVEGDLVVDRDLELVVHCALHRRLLRCALALERLPQLRLLPVQRVADPAAQGGADGRPVNGGVGGSAGDAGAAGTAAAGRLGGAAGAFGSRLAQVPPE